MPTTSYDSQASTGVAYLLDVVARLSVVRMVNEFDILMVSQAGGNIIRVAPQCEMMDSRAPPAMIDKKLAQELRLTINDLDSCPFTIVTSIGHVERATGYNQEPLQLCFQVKSGDPSAPLVIRCAMTDATNYDILVG